MRAFGCSFVYAHARVRLYNRRTIAERRLIAVLCVVHHIHKGTSKGSGDSNVCVDLNQVDTDAMVYAWAPGAPAQTYPAGVSMAMGGGTKKITTLKMQTHYDNPNVTPNVLDKSGIRIYYTTKKTEHLSGFLNVGDPSVSASGTALGRWYT